MTEGTRYLSVSFLASLCITVIGAWYSIVDPRNNVLTLPTSVVSTQVTNILTGLIYAAPLLTLVFYYIFEAISETHQEIIDTLKGTGNIEWYLRFSSQFMLAITWFLLGRGLIYWFFSLHIAFYLILLAWDYHVVIKPRRKKLEYVVTHDLIGLLLSIAYTVTSINLHRFSISIAGSHALTNYDFAYISLTMFFLGLVVSAIAANITVAIIRSPWRSGYSFRGLLPPLRGTRS